VDIEANAPYINLYTVSWTEGDAPESREANSLYRDTGNYAEDREDNKGEQVSEDNQPE
jgi:hypothetical protein